MVTKKLTVISIVAVNVRLKLELFYLGLVDRFKGLIDCETDEGLVYCISTFLIIIISLSLNSVNPNQTSSSERVYHRL